MSPYPTAPIWRRFAALIYDGFILSALSFAYGALITLGGALASPQSERYQPMFSGYWVFLGWLFVLCGFYAWFWKRGGQTLGMKTWRLQLVSIDAKPLAWTQVLKRLFFGLPSFALLGAGYWYRGFNAEGLCWHDKLSNTQVIVLPKPTKNR